ncbi:MAG: tetratricopeptide repeat protein, partial [Candidatus Obscuribacterales bacterium]|nr:tetratricopeptide repeat protein [Candidatus Obscuribacterales bacterium]
DGRYDEAQSLIEQALAKTESTFGRKHLETAAVMRDLAKVRLYQASQGDYQAAETLLKEAQANVESLTGPDHPDRATTARDLGFLYLRESRFEEAEPQFKTALDISQRILGERHAVTADSARDLGELYLLQAKLDEAKTYLERALSIDEKLYGIDAPQVAADLLSLANVFKAQNNSPEAKKLIKRANGIRDKLAITSTDSTPLLEIPVAFSSAKDRPVREKWALSIGVSNFKDSTINLKYAAKDATDFKNFLVSSERFKTDHVKLLTDENATRENIIATLGDKWLGKLAHKDDLVLVYISSHGSTSQDDAGGVNFLVAHDTDKNSLLATGIPMQWLTKMIKDQVNSDRVILILDVCHSGAAASGGKALSRIMAMTPNGLTIGSGQMVLCSSRSEQVSWESKTYENSVFTRRLMEALRVNQDKTTLLEAYNKLKDLVEAEVLRDRANLQTPVLWNKDWSGSDPVIAIETVSASSTD